MGLLEIIHLNKDLKVVEKFEFSRNKLGVFEKKNGVLVKEGGKFV